MKKEKTLFELAHGEDGLYLRERDSEETTLKCYVCGASLDDPDEVCSGRVHSEVILPDDREIILAGQILDKQGEEITLCRKCLVSLFYTITELVNDNNNPVSVNIN